MGQKAQTDRPQRGYISIDWMVLVMACVAMLFLLGSMLRTSVDPESLNLDGFQQLSGNDRLLAFQDFSFDATGWDPADTSDRLPGLGPVLGPFGNEPVQRSFAVPTDAATSQIMFDLHLIGPWAGQGDFNIALGEEEVLTVLVPEGADATELEVVQADVEGLGITVQSRHVTPRPSETALPGTTDEFDTLRVRLSVHNPPETLTLRLNAEVEGTATWTLDNLTMVASTGDRARQP